MVNGDSQLCLFTVSLLLLWFIANSSSDRYAPGACRNDEYALLGFDFVLLEGEKVDSKKVKILVKVKKVDFSFLCILVKKQPTCAVGEILQIFYFWPVICFLRLKIVSFYFAMCSLLQWICMFIFFPNLTFSFPGNKILLCVPIK